MPHMGFRRAGIVALCLLAGFISGCGGSGGSAPAAALEAPIRSVAEAQQKSAWTVLVYLDADNDLESAGISNFDQMQQIGSTKDVHVVVQMALQYATDVDGGNWNWTGARRYLVLRSSSPDQMASVRLADPPSSDMGDWHTLQDFVDWGVQQFPADHYCLVIWDHGSGWQFRSGTSAGSAAKFKYVALDSTTGDAINVTEIPSALANVKMDVVAFDACYMQQLEVAYEMRNSADYMVGSVDTEPSPGYNYATILSRMSASTSAAELCRTIVGAYAQQYPPPYTDITQCAVDLSQIGNVGSAAGGFAQMLMSNSGTHAAGLAAARTGSLDYSLAGGGPDTYNIDLLDYARRCQGAIGANADSAYAALKSAWGSAVVAEYHSPELTNACGASVYVPPPGAFDSHYLALQFAQDTLWANWAQHQPQ